MVYTRSTRQQNNLEKILTQEALIGKNMAALRMYKSAYKNSPYLFKIPFALLFVKQLLFLCMGFLFNLIIKRADVPAMTLYYNAIKELTFHFRKYKELFKVSSIWIGRIKDTFPLTS